MKLKLLISFLLFFTIYINAAELNGKVIHISDGDTIHVLTNDKKKYKIRLNGIDAPESSQDYGNKSKENLKRYIYNKDVTVIYKPGFWRPFRILCQLGKIKNTKGHKYENRDRCRAIC